MFLRMSRWPGTRAAWLALLLCACTNRAGMPCQQQSDCRSGLVCSFPPVDAATPPGAPTYGVCQPALRGDGETCLYSSECQTGLLCSNELGVFSGDRRHGFCQAQPADAGPGADAGLRDAGTDAHPVDAGDADARPADAADGGPDLR